MVEGWSPCPQVGGHGPKNINGYVNKWGRQTFTAMLMLLFIILLIKRSCSQIHCLENVLPRRRKLG